MRDPAEILANATLALEAGKHAEAIKLYRRLLKMEPNNHDALHFLGVALAQIGELSEGKLLIDRAIRLYPRSAEQFLNLARINVAAGDFDESESNFETANKISPVNTRTIFSFANALEEAGQLEKSLRYYNLVLTHSPENFDALLNRGTVHQLLGQNDNALRDYESAIDANPSDPRPLYNMGVCLRALGQLNRALAVAQQAIAKDPSYVDAIALAAFIKFDQELWGDAVRFARRAVSLKLDHHAARSILGLSFSQIGRHDDAIRELQAVLKASPSDAAAHFNIAFALARSRKFTESIFHYRNALAIKPDYIDARMNYATALREVGKFDEAMHEYERTITISPNYAEAHFNYAVALQDSGKPKQALRHYDTALSLKENFLPALYNKGTALHAMGELTAADSIYQTVLEIQPNHQGAMWNRSLVALAKGNLRRGWELFEYRFILEETQGVYSSPIPFAKWTGERIVAGSSLLVLHEQGLGDTIQFARFLRPIINEGVTVEVLAPKALQRLLLTIPGIGCVSDTIDLTKGYVAYTHMMSLPNALAIELTDLPATEFPLYLISHEAVYSWGLRVKEKSNARKTIGVAWRGGNISKIRGRGVSVEHISRLIAQDAGETTFVSLQKELLPSETHLANIYSNFLHFDDQLDFYDTAALISNLDMVISVDTSVAHLAAALGKPTIILLPTPSDWRWMESRLDSPWYPSVQLIRQNTPGDWDGVFAALSELIN